MTLVLLFHFELGPFHGGFLGVTVFFTLSGFLICSRTVAEVRRSGTFSPARFFDRRIRRLAAAALCCVAVTTVLTNVLGKPEQRQSIGGDAAAAVANVANWRFLLHGTNYTDLFAAPSPLNHFWSLAIEEQFYLVFPLVVIGILALPRRWRPVAAVGLLTAALLWSVRSGWVASGYDRFYYGTDARAAELLVGVALALVFARWHPSRVFRYPVARVASRVAAMAALTALPIMAVVFRNGSPAYQHGGALAVAALTAVLIVGALEGRNRAAQALSARPLVWLGAISYGVYLYHFPIFALSGTHWGPLHGLSLSLTQFTASVLVAAASYRLIEQPVMRHRLFRTPRAIGRAWAGAVAVVLLLIGSLVVADPAVRYARAGSAFDYPASKVPPPALPPAADTGPRPLRVLVTGDSTGEVIANALARYERAHPNSLTVLDLTRPGCPITVVHLIRHYQGERGQNVDACGPWPLVFPGEVRRFRPDVSLVFLSMMEQADQMLTPSSGWSNVLEPSWRAHQDHDFGTLVDALTGTGGPVLWADVPYMKFQADLPWISDTPQRTDALNALFRQVAGEHPRVTILDYAWRLNRPDHVVDRSIRPDGIHMTDHAADALLASWLVGRIEPYDPTRLPPR